MVTTGLKCYVRSCPSRTPSGRFQRHHFCMSASSSHMPTACKDTTVTGKHATYTRIGAR